MSRDEDRLVYSTDQPLPPKPKKTNVRPAAKSSSTSRMPDDGIIRVARERRRASSVTLITGLAANELDGVARDLKHRCGGGGSVKDGVIVLQGDHRDMITAYFEALGRRCKKAGG